LIVVHEESYGVEEPLVVRHVRLSLDNVVKDKRRCEQPNSN
jgi:hypothetical protein